MNKQSLNTEALSKSISSLAEQLRSKGYDDIYSSTFGRHSFEDSLKKHIRQCIQTQDANDKQILGRLVLSNLMKQTEQHSVTCHLHLDFMEFDRTGKPEINIEKLVIDLDNFYGNVSSKIIYPQKNKVPHRTSVTEIMTPRKKGLRL
jgi:hypothetical protein